MLGCRQRVKMTLEEMRMNWSDNVKNPPLLINYDEFDQNKASYPFVNKGGDSEFIKVDDHSVTFVGQRGPIKEYGVNGCQIDDVVTFALGTVQTFNKKFPCRENSIMITKLEEALHWSQARKNNRQQRGVEGYNKD